MKKKIKKVNHRLFTQDLAKVFNKLVDLDGVEEKAKQNWRKYKKAKFHEQQWFRDMLRCIRPELDKQKASTMAFDEYIEILMEDLPGLEGVLTYKSNKKELEYEFLQDRINQLTSTKISTRARRASMNTQENDQMDEDKHSENTEDEISMELLNSEPDEDMVQTVPESSIEEQSMDNTGSKEEFHQNYVQNFEARADEIVLKQMAAIKTMMADEKDDAIKAIASSVESTRADMLDIKRQNQSILEQITTNMNEFKIILDTMKKSQKEFDIKNNERAQQHKDQMNEFLDLIDEEKHNLTSMLHEKNTVEQFPKAEQFPKNTWVWYNDKKDVTTTEYPGVVTRIVIESVEGQDALYEVEVTMDGTIVTIMAETDELRHRKRYEHMQNSIPITPVKSQQSRHVKSQQPKHVKSQQSKHAHGKLPSTPLRNNTQNAMFIEPGGDEKFMSFEDDMMSIESKTYHNNKVPHDQNSNRIGGASMTDKHYILKNANNNGRQLQVFDYYLTKATIGNIRCESQENIMSFYDSLRAKLEPYNILLQEYGKITRTEGVQVLNESNSVNYLSANKCMSKAVYNFLDDHKESIFQDYMPGKALLDGFRRHRDGFEYLTRLLEPVHPKLRNPMVPNRKISRVPLLRCESIYSFINKYLEWLDYESQEVPARLYSDSDRLNYIISELESFDDDRMRGAIVYLMNQRDQLFCDPLSPKPLPIHLQLDRIAMTIIDRIPPEARFNLENIEQDYPVVNKMFNRHNDANKSKSYNKVREGNKNQAYRRKITDDICPVCKKYGHKLPDCDELAIIVNTQKFLETADKEVIQKAVKAFDKHQYNKRKSIRSRTRFKSIVKSMEAKYNDDQIQTAIDVLKDVEMENEEEGAIMCTGQVMASDSSGEE